VAEAERLRREEKELCWRYHRKFDNGDGTVTDYKTYLMWQQSGSDTELDFEEAVAYVQELNYRRFADCRDWRLPTIDELRSLLTSERQSNGLYIEPIFKYKYKPGDLFLSSSLYGESSAWRVDFRSGFVQYYFKSHSDYVRAVRNA